MNRLCLGLTGPTGSGKSEAAHCFRKKGFEVIDCDKLSRIAVQSGGRAIAELIKAFGSDIMDENGELIRPLLARRAFASEEGRRKLNAAVHPTVLAMTAELLEKHRAEGRDVLIDAPLLFETKLDELCDYTICTLASPEIRIQRICERDNIDREMALLRMSAQHDEEYYLQRADFVLRNNGSLEAFTAAADELAQQLLLRGGVSE